ncbi:MAG: fatty acid desaturase [Luteimonas sp.]|nr:fatty acid desaturase [Luteimonas sp.]
MWSERLSFALDRLPYVYAAALALAFAALLLSWRSEGLTLLDGIQWTLSLWVVCVFGTCVAHDLIHRPTAMDRAFGHMLGGLVGYPFLGYEHLRHHRLAGRTAEAEWPAYEESLWRFASRRLRRIVVETVGTRGLAWHGDLRSPTARGLRLSLVTTASLGMAFGAMGGWIGLAVFGLLGVLVAFTIQLVTYMQHWGLGEDCLPDARRLEWAWEDDCRFQGWITLNLSLHQSHHATPALAYYRVGLSRMSPRLPAGYVLLMFAALIPPLWRRIMIPARAFWIAQPAAAPSAGRRVTCVAIYRAQ